MQFVSKLKDMYTEVRATSRLAIAGSGMVALLKTLRAIAPNGYTSWSAMARVHLGATPPRESIDAMAAGILKDRSSRWPQAVAALVTDKFVLKQLESGGGTTTGITPLRPALVAHLADLMGAADVGSAQLVAETAFRELQSKLSRDTWYPSNRWIDPRRLARILKEAD